MAPPPPPCCPRSLPALMEELVEEILLRIPPDEPAHLFRAALVCKPWRRILTDAGFLRRYRAFHRAPPLLGYLHNLGHDNRAGIPPHAPTSAASPLYTHPEPMFITSWVLDCRHGRVLFHVFMPDYLVIWDPITGSQKKLSLPGYSHRYYAGAVLCAVDGCDHLDCHDGPFLVVFAGSGEDDDYYEFETWVATYSSESGQWSAPITIHESCVLATKPSLLIGEALYFSTDSSEDGDTLKFDMGAHKLSVVVSPGAFGYEAMAVEVDGGELGFITLYEDNCIYMWTCQGDAYSDTGGWAYHLVIELETVLQEGEPFLCSHEVVGFLEGTSTIFITVAGVGVFALDLKSRNVKKVGKEGPYYVFLPYTSFYTPDICQGHTLPPRGDAILIDLLS